MRVRPKSLQGRVLGALILALPGAAATPLRAQGVAELQVTPSSVTVQVGRKQTLFVAAFDAQGNVLPTARFAFRSSDSSVARVDGEGVVVGITPGLARVDVLSQNRRVAVAVFVTAPGAAAGTPPTAAEPSVSPPAPAQQTPGKPAPVAQADAPAPAALRLDPATLLLLPGESLRLSTIFAAPDGSAADAVPLSWRALRPAVAKVSVDGTVTGVAPGDAIIQASGPRGLSATAAVTVATGDFALAPAAMVHGPGALDTIRAIVPAQGNRAVGGGLSWRAADSTVARVGPTGIVQAVAAGETDIIASGFGQDRRAHITVYRRPEILILSPRPSAGAVMVPLSGTVVLGVRPLAADSSPVPQAPVAWEVGDSTIVTLDRATGRVTGRALGTTSVAARVEGFEPALWVVTVMSGDIAFAAPRIGLAAGESTTLVPRYADSAAGSLASRFDWTSDHPGVATVGPDGVVSAVAPGRTVITAWAPWGRTAAADLIVTGDLLVSSDRAGRGVGIYQLRTAAPDSLVPVLADTATNVQAAWSPDRTRIVFSSNRGGDFDLYLMDADGTAIRPLAPAPGTDGEPAWSPDGKRIVFSSARGGSQQIWSVGSDGLDLRQLTTAAGASAAPSFSPDGRTIAFVSSRDGNYEVYLMDADGGSQRRMTTTGNRELAPHFLADGSLAWAVDRGARGGSSILREAGAATAALAEMPATVLSWSPSRDGRTIAVVTGRSAGRGRTDYALSLVPVSGGAAVPIPLRPAEQPVTPSF
jgi:dipeptidyl aminopeptidase/acylaminoacyl peptidase